MEDDKPYSIFFEERDHYLYVFVTGEQDSLEISMLFWKEIADKCLALDCARLLVEEDLPASVKTLDMYQLGEYLASLRLPRVKTAFVDRRIEQQELNEFAMTVAKNRGLNGMIFNDVPTAEAWLLES